MTGLSYPGNKVIPVTFKMTGFEIKSNFGLVIHFTQTPRDTECIYKLMLVEIVIVHIAQFIYILCKISLMTMSVGH